MGLDMYLTKEHYIGAEYDHRNVTGSIDIKIGKEPVKIDFNKISTVRERCGYWRKANHIHKWFVSNVQEGEDDCNEYEVSFEQLKQLLEDCKKVKENKGVAAETLPTQSGFFFGGNDYDEYYFSVIDDTIKIVEDLLKDTIPSEHGGYLPYDIIYRSSW